MKEIHLTQFNELGLAEPLLRAILAEGYSTPTPIQNQTIPALCAGEDVLGIAQTGTGKTAAFVLPILDKLVRESKERRPNSCRALIVTPTRELAAQIVDNIKSYGRHSQPKVALIVGGVKPFPQIKAMSKGVDIIVATPGRLEDHMSSNKIRLDQAQMVVLDEADQMLDLGFLPAIRRIMRVLPRVRQTALFSATMPKPIMALASDFQTSPREVRVTPTSTPVEKIAQQIIPVEPGGKLSLLIDLLKAPDVKRAVVFTRTKHGANKVCKKLIEAGYSCDAIHGNKSQSHRMRALKGFASGDKPILIATDIAARGIDIDDVSHVFNYELPEVPEAYVHRIGRTARAGKSGIAIGFCAPAERKLLRAIEKLIGITLLEGDDSDFVALPKPSRGPRRPNRSSKPKGNSRRRSNKSHVEKSNKPTRASSTGRSSTGQSSRGRNTRRPGARKPAA